MLGKNQWLRAGKIAVGCSLAIIWAEMLGLNYAASAGIITLLTILGTKKETLALCLKRLLSFLMTVGFSFLVFRTAGIHWIAFSIVIFAVVSIILQFQWEDTLSVNAVICTHFISERTVGLTTISNEFILLLVGTSLAVLMNLVNLSGKKSMRREIERIEAQLQRTLLRLADNLLAFDQEASVTEDIDLLEAYLERAAKLAMETENNTFNKAARYYTEYTQMRYSQCSVLRNFQSSLRSMSGPPPQAERVAAFMKELAGSLMEQNNMESMLAELDSLFDQMQNQPLPSAWPDFENRSILYHLMMELMEFLKIKRHFCDSLTEEEIRRYWR